eukprot:6147630-Amphidinium_carterae.1
MDTWGRTAYQMFVDSVRWARLEHEKWLDMSPEEQAGMERTYVLGSINPEAPDTITAHMRTLLPSTEYSRIGIAKDVMKQPRNGIPRDMTQAIAWLEDFFN